MYGSVWVSKFCENCSNITFSVRESHLTFRMYFQITLYMYVCMYVCMYAGIYVCVCVCVYIYMCVCVCVCVKFGTSYRYFSLVKLAYLFVINNQ